MAAARGLLLLPLLAAVSFCVAGDAAAPSPGRRLLQAPGGGWTPVPDAGDPRIQGLGNWAVSKHDRLTGDRLVFQQVSRAETQDVVGVDYRLHVKAAGGDAGIGTGTAFVAVVWESGDSGMRKLISFDAE
ncbi:cysteine proteinase inhibitor 8-like [Oryza brachyantha]|uniref:Cysteine proteinase inhibitor n=1 Tax=Oryza brachyantha TaxID=4533 RepID=J3N3W5_ORYBR|nr:cysteine proteinase inhibitor 8-like [Oryza brachyantha]